MPTATELRAEATKLGQTISSLTGLWGVMERRRAETGLRGGRVAVAIDTAYAAGIANASSLAGTCDSVIDELTRRARLCDQFTADMRAFEGRRTTWFEARDRYFLAEGDGRHVIFPGPMPTPPSPPFPGAQAE